MSTSPPIRGISRRPGSCRARVKHGLEEQRQERDRTEQREADDQREQAGDAKHLVAQHRDRQHRLARAALDRQEHAEQPHPRDRDEHRLPRAPRPGRAAEACDQHDRAQSAREHARAEIVDRGPATHARGRQRRGDHHQCDQADGQVHIEDPAPRQVLDDHAPEQRAGDAREAEDGSEQPLIAPALARRDDIADRRLHEHDQSAGAEPLHRAEGDQLGHRLGQPAQSPSPRGTAQPRSAGLAYVPADRRACRTAA